MTSSNTRRENSTPVDMSSKKLSFSDSNSVNQRNKYSSTRLGLCVNDQSGVLLTADNDLLDETATKISKGE